MKLNNKLFFIVFIMLFAVFTIFADGTNLGEWFKEKFVQFGINPEMVPYLVVFILAMAPISELRGSILYGALIGLDIFWVVVISVVGNIIPVFFILFLLGFFEGLLRRFMIFDRLFDWIFKKTMAKSEKVEKYGEVGLTLFVAIPSPLTGAWTGSLVAYLMKLSYLKSLLFIFIGVLIACAIVTPIGYIFKTLPTFIKLVSVLLILVLLLIYFLINTINKKKKSDQNV
jgi:uncharacterized membrane protein